MSVQVTPSNTLRTNFNPCRPGFQDRVYKVVSGVEIPVRIWPARKGGEGTGWLLWIHGGGWQSGNPYAIAPMIHPAFGDDFHIVSVSYRYIPQVGIAEEIKDCVDAFQWCRQNLSSIVPGIAIDKYWVGGDSAGGTLSVLMGHHLKPSPRAVLDVYGVVDFLDPHFFSPYPAAIDLEGREDLEKRLEEAIKDRDASKAAHARPARFHLGLPAEVLRSFWGKEDLKIDLEAATFDCDLYDYTTATGQRVTLLLRKEECATAEAFDERCREHSALHMLDKKEKEGAKAYPPCFILHGTGDALVPVDQSYRFEQKLKDLGVPVEARYFDGEPHGFDQRIDGPQSSEWPPVVRPIIDFVQAHVK